MLSRVVGLGVTAPATEADLDNALVVINAAVTFT
jgi:hypothetical protein